MDKDISKVSTKKICYHLWYLTEETVALSFFDDSIPHEIKREMVKALKKKPSKNPIKRLIIQTNQIDDTFLGK